MPFRELIERTDTGEARSEMVIPRLRTIPNHPSGATAQWQGFTTLWDAVQDAEQSGDLTPDEDYQASMCTSMCTSSNHVH